MLSVLFREMGRQIRMVNALGIAHGLRLRYDAERALPGYTAAADPLGGMARRKIE